MGKRSSSAGKGDIPRPIKISKLDWDNNWDLAFGKKKRKEVKDDKIEQ